MNSLKLLQQPRKKRNQNQTTLKIGLLERLYGARKGKQNLSVRPILNEEVQNNWKLLLKQIHQLEISPKHMSSLLGVSMLKSRNKHKS